jgi:2,4-dienoyl-CoA reductase-like NADH-dependent reductase (Old Yellow Enzyme family)/thioredoxin reductase
MLPSYPDLMKPIRLRGVDVRNRIVFSGHATKLCEAQVPSERLRAYYVARARGGVGLIVSELVSVYPPEESSYGPLASAYKPATLEAWKRTVDACHEHGATIVQQLYDAGRQGSALESFKPVIGPSAVPWGIGRERPREMKQKDIRAMIDAFVQASGIVCAAGFDGIELHGAHGYLLQQFMSRASNQRADEYGGSVENRARFVLELLEAVRAVAGAERVVGLRIDGEEFAPDGLTIEEAVEFAKLFSASGHLDYLMVSGGSFAAGQASIVPTMYAPHQVYADYADRVSDAVDIPVVAVGRITQPAAADALIRSQKADMVVMTRALIADPDLPRKAMAGDAHGIRHCVGVTTCLERVHMGFRIGCAVNPEAGEEYDLSVLDPPSNSETQDIVVVGGGAAGCELARRASIAGHRVRLFEAEDDLGGQLRVLSRAPGLAEFSELVRFQRHELERLAVDVTLGTRLTVDDLASLQPAMVVLASGSIPVKPTGLGGKPPAWATDVRQVMQRELPDGAKAVVYVEDRFLQGLTVADWLVRNGATVQVVSPLAAFGEFSGNVVRPVLLRRLIAADVPMVTGHVLDAVDPACRVARFRARGSGEQLTVDEIDILVYDCGAVPDTALEDALEARDIGFRAIGDCLSPRNLIGAMRDAARLAPELGALR